jgi:hypothetical protein
MCAYFPFVKISRNHPFKVEEIPFICFASRSGFYFCPLSSLECDAGGLLDQWQEVAKEKVMQVDERQENRIANNFPI